MTKVIVEQPRLHWVCKKFTNCFMLTGNLFIVFAKEVINNKKNTVLIGLFSSKRGVTPPPKKNPRHLEFMVMVQATLLTIQVLYTGAGCLEQIQWLCQGLLYTKLQTVVHVYEQLGLRCCSGNLTPHIEHLQILNISRSRSPRPLTSNVL